jgi:hypothetical protein
VNHTHEFAAIWLHYGKYGPQDVHYHPCIAVFCNHVIVGPGRDCDGNRDTHYRGNL